MKKCLLSNSNALFNKIAENNTLYIPVDLEQGRVAYKKFVDGLKMSDALKTDRSAKDFFFPQTETLMAFKTDGRHIEVIDTRSESEDFVVFGVRGCDVKSLEVLDKVFLAEPVDTYYANRREHGVIVSMACSRPTETCFCQTFGVDASAPAGDIVCYKTDDAFYFDAKTEKGQKVLDQIGSVLEDCDDAAVKAEQAKIKEMQTSRLYDASIYPPIENTPPRFAISKRNEWMMTNADLIIVYVNHNYGGAYQSLQVAKRKKKEIINICEFL